MSASSDVDVDVERGQIGEKGEKGQTGENVVAHEKVDWDGPDDPANPMNWPTGKKAAQLVLMAANTFITYVPFFSLGGGKLIQVQPARLVHVRARHPRRYERLPLDR